eukprot:6179330-Pleurochrysis_carterae.AAC.2
MPHCLAVSRSTFSKGCACAREMGDRGGMGRLVRDDVGGSLGRKGGHAEGETQSRTGRCMTTSENRLRGTRRMCYRQHGGSGLQ